MVAFGSTKGSLDLWYQLVVAFGSAEDIEAV
jgi:hypothetical protein